MSTCVLTISCTNMHENGECNLITWLEWERGIVQFTANNVFHVLRYTSERVPDKTFKYKCNKVGSTTKNQNWFMNHNKPYKNLLKIVTNFIFVLYGFFCDLYGLTHFSKDYKTIHNHITLRIYSINSQIC